MLRAPQHEYTRALLDAVPSEHTRGTRLVRGTAPSTAARTRRPIDRGRPLLEAPPPHQGLPRPRRVDRTVVDDVSFELYAGETLGIVGESGSGKTTTARIALAMLEADGGEVLLRGEPWSALSQRAAPAAAQPGRGRLPGPAELVRPALDGRADHRRRAVTRTEPPTSRAERRRTRVLGLLEQVGLGAAPGRRRPAAALRRPAAARRDRPGARSRAELIVCDEPVSALDVSVQAQVLDLLTDLQDELGVSYLFISHDLGVIHHMSDRVLVMKDGKVVERGTADDIFQRPQDPYTQRLLTALPRLEQAS